MTFSKRYPKNVPGSSYPEWIEVTLSDEEERIEEETATRENNLLMEHCIDDAKLILQTKELQASTHDVIQLATSLFEKRASHAVYWKERKLKEKFDKTTLA